MTVEIINVQAYVAGPYRAETVYEVRQNIAVAEQIGLALWREGVPTLIPHKNTALFDGTAPDSVWLQGDIVMLNRCDAIVMTPAWRDSSGARAEHQFALQKGLSVFQIPDMLSLSTDAGEIAAQLKVLAERRNRPKTCELMSLCAGQL